MCRQKGISEIYRNTLFLSTVFDRRWNITVRNVSKCPGCNIEGKHPSVFTFVNAFVLVNDAAEVKILYGCIAAITLRYGCRSVLIIAS